MIDLENIMDMIDLENIMDIVQVTWLDNALIEGWAQIGDVCEAFGNVANRTHVTTGVLLFDNEDWICVAFAWNAETGQAQTATMINQKSIIEMEVIGYAEVAPDIRDEEQEGAGEQGSGHEGDD